MKPKDQEKEPLKEKTPVEKPKGEDKKEKIVEKPSEDKILELISEGKNNISIQVDRINSRVLINLQEHFSKYDLMKMTNKLRNVNELKGFRAWFIYGTRRKLSTL